MPKKARNIGLFCYPNLENFFFDFHRWHWAVLAMCKDLNSQKCKSNPLQRSKYRQISIFSAKNSTQSFGLGFSGFHEMWKRWIESFFILPQTNDRMPIRICEPFLTAAVAGRGTTPPRKDKAAVDDLWASCGRYIPQFALLNAIGENKIKSNGNKGGILIEYRLV